MADGPGIIPGYANVANKRGFSEPSSFHIHFDSYAINNMFQVAGVEVFDEGPDTPTTGRSGGGWQETGAARARLDAGGAHAGLLGGSPLTLFQGIIPGNHGKNENNDKTKIRLVG